MGGHGHGAHRNEHNMKESDEEMQGKIQLIETIKHNPTHWHMPFWSVDSWFTILGGW